MGASPHAKTSVHDRQELLVGSANLDPRSGKLITELSILFQSEPLAEGFRTGSTRTGHASPTASLSIGASAGMSSAARSGCD